jgi:hypothetical protein
MNPGKERQAGEGVNELRRTRSGVEVECWDNTFELSEGALRYWGECRNCGGSVEGGEIEVMKPPPKAERLRLWEEFYERVAAHSCGPAPS